MMKALDHLKFNADGLVPVVVQETGTSRVLMLAWMNRESIGQTLRTGRAHYWSRSRQQLWIKGETSGHIQRVEELAVDCDGDTLLMTVQQTGPACHEGYKSCFFRRIAPDGESVAITEAPMEPGPGT
jgi:phosphoribosyl-AMP cyclohydrolase